MLREGITDLMNKGLRPLPPIIFATSVICEGITDLMNKGLRQTEISVGNGHEVKKESPT